MPGRARTFAVGRRKGASMSVWLARPAAEAAAAPTAAAPTAAAPAWPARASTRPGRPLPALPWRVTGVVAGPESPPRMPAMGAVAESPPPWIPTQPAADALLRRSRASAPAPSEMARPAAATPAASVGAIPAA